MSTKKSNAMKDLESIYGKPLSFGTMMESIRLSDSYTQTEFAKKLSISATHLCDIEKGRKAVSVERAVKFAKILGYSKEQFVRLALQDQVDLSGIKLRVDVRAA